MQETVFELQDRKTDKELYSYQQGAIQQIFDKFDSERDDYHLLYQLPTQIDTVIPRVSGLAKT